MEKYRTNALGSSEPECVVGLPLAILACGLQHQPKSEFGSECSFSSERIVNVAQILTPLFQRSVMNNLARRLSSLNTEVIVSIVVYTYEATAQLVSRLPHQRVSLKTQRV